MNEMKSFLIITLLIVALSACGTGTIISKDGSTKEPKWHQPNSVILNNQQGTFPNVENLKLVKPGITKDQLYALLGRPQYDDGWRPREWNYLLHFNTPGYGNNDVTTCQFKVLFDEHSIAQTFYWHPVIPKDAVCPIPEDEKEELISKNKQGKLNL